MLFCELQLFNGVFDVLVVRKSLTQVPLFVSLVLQSLFLCVLLNGSVLKHVSVSCLCFCGRFSLKLDL